MKRILLVVFTVALAIGLVIGNQVAAEEGETKVVQETPKVQLTKAQQAELATLYDEVFQDHQKIIEKYVEYGVLTKEKGDKIVSKMEQHQVKLKENGYVPMWRHHHKKTHHSKEKMHE